MFARTVNRSKITIIELSCNEAKSENRRKAMTVKERLHQMIEEMPEDRLERASQLLDSLATEPVSYAEVIDRLIQEMPEEVVYSLPVDLSENLDHYAYGKPKK
jgi:hypothetical protein